MAARGPSVVASGDRATTECAAELLRAGGNAFDAAVGAGFGATVAEPALTSLGGGGFLLARTAAGASRLFDFFVDTPGDGAIAHEPHFEPVTIRFPGSSQLFNVGRGSVAVPGTLAGLLHVHERLGRLPLEQVVAPAISLARNGVELSAAQAYFLGLLSPIFNLTEGGRRQFGLHEGQLSEGRELRNPELAAFLETLPKTRGHSFYHGEIARTIEDDLRRDGLLTTRDLASYRVIERQPLEVPYREFRLLSNPAPSFGGSLLGLALRLTAEQQLGASEWGSATHLRTLAAVNVEVARLRESGSGVGHGIDVAGAESAERIRRVSGGTTHLCVADAEGNVATLTASNGEGSGYVVPGTGIMLNNMLGEDDLHPEGFHSDPPGVRVSSMMSPSILLEGDTVRLAIGSGGSKRIRSAIYQVLTHRIDFGLELQAAIDAPRLHWDGERMQLEPGFPLESIEAVRNYWPTNLWKRHDVYFGGVQAVEPGVAGAADPRRGGVASRVEH
ncbi:MAG: gamma-glutamyltransferase [Myxococcota bacterium]|nr:gamma-glutamyltransferase [Myxococcota bacterium]